MILGADVLIDFGSRIITGGGETTKHTKQGIVAMCQWLDSFCSSACVVPVPACVCICVCVDRCTSQ